MTGFDSRHPDSVLNRLSRGKTDGIPRFPAPRQKEKPREAFGFAGLFYKICGKYRTRAIPSRSRSHTKTPSTCHSPSQPIFATYHSPVLATFLSLYGCRLSAGSYTSNVSWLGNSVQTTVFTSTICNVSLFFATTSSSPVFRATFLSKTSKPCRLRYAQASDSPSVPISFLVFECISTTFKNTAYLLTY